jgi:hypothetical protein
VDVMSLREVVANAGPPPFRDGPVLELKE